MVNRTLLMVLTTAIVWNMIVYTFYSTYQSVHKAVRVDIRKRLKERAARKAARKAGVQNAPSSTPIPTFLPDFDPETVSECDRGFFEEDVDDARFPAGFQPLFLDDLWNEIALEQEASFEVAEGVSRIPPIIHQSWKTDMVPEFVYGGNSGADIKNISQFIGTWTKKNPTWTYMFWRDEDNMRMFETTPELEPFVEAFKMDIPGVARADFSRYAYMYLFGGVYADIDFECFLPFDVLSETFDLILSSEPVDHTVALYDMPEVACNAFMASKPGHDFWLLVMQKITEAIKSDKGALCRRDANFCTGPQRLQKVYEEYAIYNPTANPIAMLPWHYFYNEVAEYNAYLHNQCKKLELRRRYQCKFRSPRPADEKIPFQSFGVHHWSNQWSQTLTHEVPTKLNITTIVPPSQFKRPFSTM
jgi:mannosyltransferase OCH1-like enzyme